jgi:signal transduction histidine kinase
MTDFLKQYFKQETKKPTQVFRKISEEEGTEEPKLLPLSTEELQDQLDQKAEGLTMAIRAHALQYLETLAAAYPELKLIINPAAHLEEPHSKTKEKMRKAARKSAGRFFRFQIRGSENILSARASCGLVEFFLVPNKEMSHISTAEFGNRYRGCFNYIDHGEGFIWRYAKGQELDAQQAKQTIEALIDELVLTETDALKAENRQAFTHPMETSANNYPYLDQSNLLFRLVNQEEVLKNNLARDLHDSVIADLMMLKRYLLGDKPISTEETIEIIDETLLQLRDLVNAYSPRQLEEWGLKVGVEDLLDRLGRRTGISTNLIVSGTIPNLPQAVTLHIFRIIQEALNNAEKHANARNIDVDINVSQGSQAATTTDDQFKTAAFEKIVISIEDNGEGFEPTAVSLDSDTSHNFGLRGLKERIKLIRCFYPCQIKIESQPGQGTKISLQLEKPSLN